MALTQIMGNFPDAVKVSAEAGAAYRQGEARPGRRSRRGDQDGARRQAAQERAVARGPGVGAQPDGRNEANFGLRNEASFQFAKRSQCAVVGSFGRSSAWGFGVEVKISLRRPGLSDLSPRVFRPPMVWTASAVSDVTLYGAFISVYRFDAWPSDIRWDGDHRYPDTTGCN
jgi:hypothetical protein